VTVTLPGLTLGPAAASAGVFNMQSSADTIAIADKTAPVIDTAATFTLITLGSSGVGSLVLLVLVFTSVSTVAATSGTITLGSPTQALASETGQCPSLMLRN